MTGRPKFRSVLIYGSVLIILVALSLVSFLLFFHPQKVGNNYLQSVQQEAAALHGTFKQLDKTTQLNVFNDPDAATKEQDLNTTSATISSARVQIDKLKKASTLQPAPHVTLSNSYHDAKITHQLALDVAGQSDDVLTQYERLVSFLKQYYALDGTFVALTTKVNTVTNLDSLAPSTHQLQTEGRQLAGLVDLVNTLQPPTGYAPLNTQAGTIYKQAAQGFNTLAYGLSTNNDTYKNNGIYLVEQAVNQHDNTLSDLPINIAQSSYILTQVSELPDKTDGITSAQNDGY